MASLTHLAIVSAFAVALASCAGDPPALPSYPTPPSSVPPPQVDTTALMRFLEPSTGFSTTDLYDAHDRVLQVSLAGGLVVAETGVKVQGVTLASYSSIYGPPTYFISSTVQMCEVPCDLSVRFGADGGRRRAYLTVDYGHSNPGTRVDVAVVDGVIVVTQTASYPPGTPTLSGTITEMTADGPVPVSGALVARGVPAGWQSARSDENGFYSVRGLIDGVDDVLVLKAGYQQAEARQLQLNGDRQLDFRILRR
jgi:hypothetical protein